MCGILGIATVHGRPLAISEGQVLAMRDQMTHRGPDDAALWRNEHVVFAHRRLAVVDPFAATARQPMVSPDGRTVLIYNGELYNDAEVRQELGAHGVTFRGKCDAETVLMAMHVWGKAALPRLRGMFAIASYDTRSRELVLARDPLGIKPLFFRLDGGDQPRVVFASEPAAILAHPDVAARPDLVTISWYLTTLRTTMGNRTLFDGVRTLRPGEVLTVDLSAGARWPTGGGGGLELAEYWRSGPIVGGRDVGAEDSAARATITDSVRRHLRADVPVALLLSGGLDSTIIAAETLRVRREMGERAEQTRTYAAGAAGAPSADLVAAREVASHFGTTHREVTISARQFTDQWEEMIDRSGLPLGTPNEVAIREIGRAIRADGCVVALSGEGADELFAGYDRTLDDAAACLARGGEVDGRFYFGTSAWMSGAVKGIVLRENVWRWLENDHAALEDLDAEFSAQRTGCGDDLSAFLRMQRRINLSGLLGRLDSALMMESIEGRTPFADAAVAEFAEGLGMERKYVPPSEGCAEPRTKLILRRAFAESVPEAVLRRPKASFALPFEEWTANRLAELGRSTFAVELFSAAGREMVMSDPRRHWNLAWPMVNVAAWGRRWWG